MKGTDANDAANYGVVITWEGWNKNQYSTELISWDNVGKKAFGANLSDYVDTASFPELEGIDFRFGWTMEETATIDDIAASVNGVRFSSTEGGSESIKINAKDSDISFDVSINYLAELASGRNVDSYDTAWIQPATVGQPNVISSPSYNSVDEEKGWKIQFRMPNIGLVTATSTYIDCYSLDRDASDKGLWWRWSDPDVPNRYKVTLWHTPDQGQGTLLGVTDCFVDSGQDGDSLSANAESGGRIDIRFDITSNNQFEYEGRKSSNIGTITMHINGRCQ